MANSTPTLPQMSPSQSSKEVEFNNAQAASSPAALFGRNYLTSTGLTWGYLGGMGIAGAVANGTVALTASSTNYIVTNRTTDAVTVATNTTNWNDTTNYRRLYSVVTGTSTVTSWIDFRNAYAASTGGGGGTPGGSNTYVQFNNSGSFGGNANFTYDATTNTLTTGTVATSASNTTRAGLKLPHGAAPTSPVDGDMWTTSTGLYVRIGSATVGPLGAGGSGMTNPMTTIGDIIVGGTSGAAQRLANGTAGYVLTAQSGAPPAWVAPTGGSLLVLEVIISTAATALTFSGLNGNADGFYFLEIEKDPSVACTWNLHVNGNTTVTDYNTQSAYSGGTSQTNSRLNSSDVVFSGTSSGGSLSTVYVTRLPAGYFAYTAFHGRNLGGASPEIQHYLGGSNFTITNITSLTLTAGSANGIGIGSKIRLYKGK